MKYSAPSQRRLRIGEQARHAVAHVLQHAKIHDPLLQGAILSISEVRMSADLRIATCFVIALGDRNPERTDRIVKALNYHAKYIRGQVGNSLRQVKYMPEFRFRFDTAFENFARINALLHSPEVKRDLLRDNNKEE